MSQVQIWGSPCMFPRPVTPCFWTVGVSQVHVLGAQYEPRNWRKKRCCWFLTSDCKQRSDRVTLGYDKADRVSLGYDKTLTPFHRWTEEHSVAVAQLIHLWSQGALVYLETSVSLFV